jgi:hypothetical protein
MFQNLYEIGLFRNHNETFIYKYSIIYMMRETRYKLDCTPFGFFSALFFMAIGWMMRTAGWFDWKYDWVAALVCVFLGLFIKKVEL